MSAGMSRKSERDLTAVVQAAHADEWKKIQKLPKASGREQAIAREAGQRGVRGQG